MSGPVWRLLEDEPALCTECGKKIDTCRAVGRIEDSTFVVTRRYCEECYRALDRFVDEVA